MEYDLPLATRNTRDFRHIEGFTLTGPFASDNQRKSTDPAPAAGMRFDCVTWVGEA